MLQHAFYSSITLLAILGITCMNNVELASGRQTKLAQGRPFISKALLSEVENEISRIESRLRPEGEAEHPPLNEQVLFFLIMGIANGAPEAKGDDAFSVEFKASKLDKPCSILHVSDDVRITIHDQYIQDKAGTYIIRNVTYHRFAEDDWKIIGRGRIASSAGEVP